MPTNLQTTARPLIGALPTPLTETPVGWLTPARALAILLGVSALLRVAWAAAMGLCNDEAYHYLFAVHPDWSYFDHPPMTMWIEWLGLHAWAGWVHPLALRSGFIVISTGSTWVLARLTARWYGDWAGFYAALLLMLTAYQGAAGAFAVPDAPFVFFALLTVWALGRVLIDEPETSGPPHPRPLSPRERGERLGGWVWVGLAFAGALLSKYHAIFLPAGVFCYLLVTPERRGLLLRPGPYLALLIGALGFAPVLIWNAQNGWQSFAFQSARAVGFEFHVEDLLTTLFGPILYLFLWNWVLMWSLLLRRLWRFGSVLGMDRLLVCLAVPPILGFLAISCMRKPLPHWSLFGFVVLFPLGGASWAAWSALHASVARQCVAGMTALVLLIAGFAVAQARFGLVPLPVDSDPLVEASGWDSVADELKERGLLDEPRTFLFTTHWYDSGQLAFAVRNQVPVLCYSAGDAHGFAHWSTPKEWIGWDGILITPLDNPKEINRLRPFFKRIERIAEFPMRRGATEFRLMRVWRCTEQTRGFPFVYAHSSARRAP